MARLVRVIAAIAVAVLLSGCGQAEDGGASGDGGGGDLDGDWQLTSGTGPAGEVPLGDGSEVTLTIAGTAWSGQACNSYSGDVQVDGDAVTIGPMTRTEMGCPDGRIMEAEAAYHAALEAVTTVAVADASLTLTGDDTELVYDRLAEVPEADLVGTTWVLESLVSGAGPEGTASSVIGAPELTLTADGRLEAGTGCNGASGTYELDGDRIVTGSLEGTAMGCEEPLATQERDIVHVFSAGPTFEVEGDQLTLDTGGLGLVYRALDPLSVPLPELGGTTWQLTGLVDGPVESSLGGPVAELRFLDDTRFTVGGGCNQRGGTYTLDRETLTFAVDPASTAVSCAGDAGTREAQIFDVVDGEVAYSYEPERLPPDLAAPERLRLDAGDLGLTYRAADGADLAGPRWDHAPDGDQLAIAAGDGPLEHRRSDHPR